MTSTDDITKAREAQRSKLTEEVRERLAAEQTADALEAIRIQLVGLSSLLGRMARNP